MPNDDYSAFHALDPFFSVVMEGLSKFTDGVHYFDTLADDVLFEFRYHMAGWPEAIRGRANLMSLYSGYGNSILLERGDALAAHPSADGHVWPSNTRFTARYSRLASPTITGLSRSLLLRTARSCAGATTWILWRRGRR
jgi:hypothetical protein